MSGGDGVGAVTSRSGFLPQPLHFRVPHGLFLVEATSVAVGAGDEVFVFCRGNLPVHVYSREGAYLRGWGNATPWAGAWAGAAEARDPYGAPRMLWRGAEYLRPHSVRCFGDSVWLVDDGGHSVTQCDSRGLRRMVLLPGGRTLREPAAMAAHAAALAERGAAAAPPPAPALGGAPLTRPTDVAVSAAGDIFVADGYGNAHVHCFSADGVLLRTFGGPGTDAGKLSLPHQLVLHGGLLFVADRENSRVQAYDPATGIVRGTLHAHRAVALARAAGQLYVAEHGAATRVHRGAGNAAADLDSWVSGIGHRICIFDTPPKAPVAELPRVATLGTDTPGERPGQILWPHSVAVDSQGSVYCAQVSFCECGALQTPHAREMVSLQKWCRIDGLRFADE